MYMGCAFRIDCGEIRTLIRVSPPLAPADDLGRGVHASQYRVEPAGDAGAQRAGGGVEGD